MLNGRERGDAMSMAAGREITVHKVTAWDARQVQGENLRRFQEGYEASFLALAGNPLDDFEAVQAIRLRVKKGRLLLGPA
jgi:hypothetical protein